MSENIRAVATEDGDVLLTIVDSKKRVRITLPIEAAQKLEAQIKAALVTARIRLRKLEGVAPLHKTHQRASLSQRGAVCAGSIVARICQLRCRCYQRSN